MNQNNIFSTFLWNDGFSWKITLLSQGIDIW